MTNIFNFEKSIKIKWLKIAITDICKHWLSLLLQDIDLKKLASVGSEYCESLLYKLNPFWKAVFMYYKDYVQHLTFKTPEDILTSSIWYNTKFGTEKIFFFDWYKNGIHIIGDIVDFEGKLMTFEQIRAKYKFPLNILNYYTVKKIAQKFVTKTELNLAKYFRRPYIPFHINALIGHHTGSKSIFYCVNTSYPMDNCFTGRRDWSRQTPEKDVLYIIPAGPVSSVHSLGGASYLLPVQIE